MYDLAIKTAEALKIHTKTERYEEKENTERERVKENTGKIKSKKRERIE